ncbi:MAG: glycoside hydrolase family 2 protein, partial [Rikenellaceae bacterium]|nr:glycoside hydrolase family 2 protein [Rikenellaceae bacterium]
MGKYRITAIISAILITATGALEARETYNFNSGWKFYGGNNPTSEESVRVNLPHTWNRDAIAGMRDYFRGMGYYIKEANIPGDWRGKRVFIKFYGSDSVTDVYVNGRHAAQHSGGYVAFATEITDYLQFGARNTFWIAVNNSPRSDVLPVGGDQNSYGGIFRDVELIVTGRENVSVVHYGGDGMYIVQKNITDEFVEAEAEIMVSGVRDNTVTATLTVRSEEGDVVAGESARIRLSGRTISEVKIPFAFYRPRLWNGVDDPYRYSVSLTIQA